MKPRTLLILAVVVAGLGAFVWFYEQKLPSSEERAAQSKRVLGVEAADIQGITIEVEGKKVRLERDPKPATTDAADAPLPPERPWRLVEPMVATADKSAADRLAESLASLEKERTLESADRKDAGLETPRAKVTLATAKGERVLEVGAAIPASYTMMVAVPGESEAHVVSSSVFTDLSKPAGDWRSKQLFAGQRDNIARITLASATAKVLLAKRDENFWVESPLTDRADRDLVNGLLSDVTGLQVATFLDEPPLPLAAMGLEPPLTSIEVVLDQVEQPFHVDFGGLVDLGGTKHFARVGTQIVEVDGRIAEAIERSAAAWRSPLLSGFEVYRVDRAELTDAQGKLAVERAGPDWKRTVGDKTETIAFTPVSDLLYALTSARATRIVERAEALTLGTNLEATLTAALFASDKSTETISLYPALADGSVPASVTGREAILLLPPEAGTDVTGKLEILRKAEPLPEKEEKEAPKP